MTTPSLLAPCDPYVELETILSLIALNIVDRAASLLATAATLD